MTYDAWKTRSPDDELFRGLPYGDAPEVWEDCPNCGGEGVIYKSIWVYEHGCGFGHDDVAAETCPTCDGTRGMICEATGN